MQVDFASEAELKAHYKAVRERLNSWKAPAKRVPLPPVIITTGSRKPWLSPMVEGIRIVPDAIDRLIESPTAIPTGQFIVHKIIRVASAYFNVTRNDILSPRREAPVVLARHIAMYLAKQETQRSLPWIGMQFGGRDHTTALSAIRKMTRRIAAEPDFAADVNAIRALALA